MNKLTEAEKAEFSKAMKEMDKPVDKIIKVFEPDPVEDYEDPVEVV